MPKSYLTESITMIFHKIGLQQQILSKFFLKKGKSILQGRMSFQQKIPDLNTLQSFTSKPELSQIFLAPNSQIIGNVNIQQETQIFYGSIIEAQQNSKIQIGQKCNIQNLVQITAQNNEMIIGDNVFIGSNTMIKNSKIGDNVIIGMGVKIGKNCQIGKNSMIGAGSILEDGQIIPENEIWVGNPIHYLRQISEQDLEYYQELYYHQDKVTQIIRDNQIKNFVLERQMNSDEYYEDIINDVDRQKYMENVDEELAVHERHLTSEKETDFTGQPLKYKQTLQYGGHKWIQEKFKKNNNDFDNDGRRVGEKWGIMKRNFDSEKQIEDIKDQTQLPSQEFFESKQGVEDTRFSNKFQLIQNKNQILKLFFLLKSLITYLQLIMKFKENNISDLNTQSKDLIRINHSQNVFQQQTL